MGLDDIDRFACHPGGTKVITALERAFALEQGALDHERAVLAEYGNMSAPTALFVLDRVIQRRPAVAHAADRHGAGLHRELRLAAESRLTPAVFLLALCHGGAAGRALACTPQHRGPAAQGRAAKWLPGTIRSSSCCTRSGSPACGCSAGRGRSIRSGWRSFSRCRYCGSGSWRRLAALDHAHHRPARRPAGDQRPLPFCHIRTISSSSARSPPCRSVSACRGLLWSSRSRMRCSVDPHPRGECGLDRIADVGQSLSKAAKPVTRGPAIGFAMMCIGMFMAILDVQVVATSLPTIQSALAIPPDQMSWIQTAYLIAEVIAIPLTGFLTRLLSMRWLFVLAIAVFTLASIGCAASGSFATLIAWRVLQGFSGGTLIPAVFSAVFLLFPAARQGMATTFAGVLAVLAPTVGPVVGGWITADLFLALAVPDQRRARASSRRCSPRRCCPGRAMRLSEARTLDILSLALLAIALAALEIALKEAPQRGWTSGLVVGLLALSLASWRGFVRRSLRRRAPDRRSPHFRRPTASPSAAC